MKTFDLFVSGSEDIKSGLHPDLTLDKLKMYFKGLTNIELPNDVFDKVSKVYFDNAKPSVRVENNDLRNGVIVTIEPIPASNALGKDRFYHESYYQVTIFWEIRHKSLNFQEESKDVAASLEWMLKCLNLEALV